MLKKMREGRQEPARGRREITGSGQYSALKKIIVARLPGQCSRDEGLQVQDSILLWKKIIAARLPGHCSQGRGFTGSGQYSAVKKIIVARLPGHCSRDEGLQRSGQYSAMWKKKHSGKATRTVHQG